MRPIGRTGIVETDRLLLRPWREEDSEELQRLFSDPAVRGGRNFPPDRIARLAEDSWQQWRLNGFGPWAATYKATGSWIGKIGLDELSDWPDVHRIEVGFELHKAIRLERIINVTAASHVAARRVMEKRGSFTKVLATG
jgi:RimJ/RimL family protein N-acetyltransferase